MIGREARYNIARQIDRQKDRQWEELLVERPGIILLDRQKDRQWEELLVDRPGIILLLKGFFCLQYVVAKTWRKYHKDIQICPKNTNLSG